MLMQVRKRMSEAARNFLARGEKERVPVPAAWPTGMAQLTQAYEACRRCKGDEVCAD